MKKYGVLIALAIAAVFLVKRASGGGGGFALHTPAQGAVLSAGATVTFSWTGPALAANEAYVVQAATDPNFYGLVLNVGIAASTLSQAFTSPGGYYWRVIHQGPSGDTLHLSATQGFTIV